MQTQHIKLAPNLKSLTALKLTELLSFYNYSKKTIFNTALVFEEIVSNIIKYSNCKSDIEIELEFYDKTIEIRIADNGKRFNPLTVPDPELSDDPFKRPIGKLGIYLSKQLSREFTYYRVGLYNINVIRIAATKQPAVEQQKREKLNPIPESINRIFFNEIFA